MNNNSNGRIIATTSLLLLVATMIIPAAFADQNAVRSFSPGKVATMADIPKGICGQVDLMLVVDDTGSMVSAIDNVKLNLATVIAAANLADVDSARIGLITFHDDVSVLHDLSATQTDVVTSINGLAPSDGGNLPEASDEAKNTAVNNLPAAAGTRADANGILGTQTGDNSATPWQTASLGPSPPKATNMMVIITDDESGGFSDSSNAIYQTHMGTLGTEAAAKGIHVGDVFVGVAEFANAKDAMVADAANSAGIYTFAPSGAGTAQAIIDIIAQCGGNPPPTVAGELLPINTMSLFISGLFTNSFWMLPAVAGIAGTGAFVIRSRMHKDQEN